MVWNFVICSHSQGYCMVVIKKIYAIISVSENTEFKWYKWCKLYT